MVARVNAREKWSHKVVIFSGVYHQKLVRGIRITTILDPPGLLAGFPCVLEPFARGFVLCLRAFRRCVLSAGTGREQVVKILL